jgi:hypothetical protein
MNFSLLLFSNHGARLIDTEVPAIECLEDIINVVDGRVEGKSHFTRISNMFSENYRLTKSNGSFEL